MSENNIVSNEYFQGPLYIPDIIFLRPELA